MHYNSQPHIKQEAEGTNATNAASEAPKEGAPKEEAKEEAKEEVAAEEEVGPEPTYDTEKRHATPKVFKKSMGLFTDKIKANYASKNFSL